MESGRVPFGGWLKGGGLLPFSQSGEMKIKAEMSGWVVEIFVAPGDRVSEGTRLLTIESMKMQIPIESPKNKSFKDWLGMCA